MGAIVNEYSFDEMLRLTFAAGNDLAMICHRIDKAAEALGVIEKLPRKQINRALASVAAFKSKMQPPTKFSESAFRKLDDAVWKLRVAVLGEERAAERSQRTPPARPSNGTRVCRPAKRGRSIPRIVRDLSTSLRSAQDDKGRTCGVWNGAIARCPTVTCRARREGAGRAVC
jgi:beta-glucosidase-like glycosyl hydrolase